MTPSTVKKTASELTEPVPLDRGRGKLPLHRQLFQRLRNEILSGLVKPGDFLPGETELCDRYNLSRATVRTALASLEDMRLIERRQGVGTLVLGTPDQRTRPSASAEHLNHINAVGLYTRARVVEHAYGSAPKHVRQEFEAEADDIFQRTVRIRSIGEDPIFHVTTFIPERIGRQFTAADLETHPLTELVERAGVQMATCRQVVSARAADAALAAYLELDIGAPLLSVRRTNFDAAGAPVQWFEMVVSPTSFELHSTLKLPEGNP